MEIKINKTDLGKCTHQCDETQGINNSAQALSMKRFFFRCKKIDNKRRRKQLLHRQTCRSRVTMDSRYGTWPPFVLGSPKALSTLSTPWVLPWSKFTCKAKVQVRYIIYIMCPIKGSTSLSDMLSIIWKEPSIHQMHLCYNSSYLLIKCITHPLKIALNSSDKFYDLFYESSCLFIRHVIFPIKATVCHQIYYLSYKCGCLFIRYISYSKNVAVLSSYVLFILQK